VPLEAVVDMAIESSRPQVSAAGHHLSVLLPSERVALDADPARLAQAFAALLANAAKHSPPQGSIGFSVAAEGREAVATVEHGGAGLEGLGVGLALVGVHLGDPDPRGAVGSAQPLQGWIRQQVRRDAWGDARRAAPAAEQPGSPRAEQRAHEQHQEGHRRSQPRTRNQRWMANVTIAIASSTAG